jgi:hypothetical protein
MKKRLPWIIGGVLFALLILRQKRVPPEPLPPKPTLTVKLPPIFLPDMSIEEAKRQLGKFIPKLYQSRDPRGWVLVFPSYKLTMDTFTITIQPPPKHLPPIPYKEAKALITKLRQTRLVRRSIPPGWEIHFPPIEVELT